MHNPMLLRMAFAIALTKGAWSRRALVQRATAALGSRSIKRAVRIVDEILEAHPAPYAPHPRKLERLLALSDTFGRIGETAVQKLASLSVTRPQPRFAPIAEFANTNIPRIATAGGLADWLGLSVEHLDWFADSARTLKHAPDVELHHYAYIWTAKRSGGERLIEAPKPRLRDVQRRILRDILDQVPVHDAAFGFVQGRNCAAAAAKHAGEDVVLTVDLRAFFLNTRMGRVHGIFRCLGYPTTVARLLTGLCATTTPRDVTMRDGVDHETRQRLIGLHLPQGAPTSPALANLVAHRLDTRLTGLARRFEARYTRYADDLTFSGDQAFRNEVPRFLKVIVEIAADEGFTLNPAKTRIMPRHSRQTVTGIVVNDHINAARPDYDMLKATLTNCARRGPTSQNRDGHADFRAHLDGRITWIENLNLRRGEKLRRIFDAIAW